MDVRKNKRPASGENPVQDSSTEEKDMQQPHDEKPMEAAAPEREGTKEKEGGQEEILQKPTGYIITCRNKATKLICGIDFVDGVGRTDDAYAASWFASKDGYTVKPAEQERP